MMTKPDPPDTAGKTKSLVLSPIMVALLTEISTSFDLLLIIATPPNAIIYSSGYIIPRDFIKAGVLMTIAAFGILSLVVALWWNLWGII